jgi:hypothetical protein
MAKFLGYEKETEELILETDSRCDNNANGRIVHVW